MDKKIKIVAVTGPTATGKTALAIRLAHQFSGEIISVDSRQVYRHMDLGTGKDLHEYGEIPYHLIDVADPARETYNLALFLRDAYQKVEDIANRGKLPVLCGGTALYLAALLNNYQLPGAQLPAREAGKAREMQDGELPVSFAPPFCLEPLVLGVYYPRQTVHERIEARLDERISAGLVDEVRTLHEVYGVPLEKLDFFGLEYRECARFLRQECSLLEMRNQLLYKIRQFAKRQDIFFRKIEREGNVIHWLKAGKEPDPAELIELFLAGEALPAPEIRISEIRYQSKR